MKTFSEKLKEVRAREGLTQQELVNRCGISKRGVAGYETADVKPRATVVKSLAEVLNVSADYLLLDNVQNINHPWERYNYIKNTRQRHGDTTASEVGTLLQHNKALFAGGTLNQEDKDSFFEAVMKAYLAYKEDARKAYGRGGEE